MKFMKLRLISNFIQIIGSFDCIFDGQSDTQITLATQKLNISESIHSP